MWAKQLMKKIEDVGDKIDGMTLKVQEAVKTASEAKIEAGVARQAATEAKERTAALEHVMDNMKQDISALKEGGRNINTGSGGGGGGNSGGSNDPETRAKQVVALGFKEGKAAKTVIDDIENILKRIMGEGHGAKVDTYTDPARMGMITF